MAIPSVELLSNRPGGAVAASMKALNALDNEMLLKRINAIKEQYAPLTTQAEAASKLAYANLVNPQYIAKIMGNPAFMANLSESQKNMLKDLAYSAGVKNQGINPAANVNAFNQMPQHTGVGQPSTNNFGNRVKNAFMELIGKNQLPQEVVNPLAQRMPAPINQAPKMPNEPRLLTNRPKGAVSIEGQQWYDQEGRPVYEEEINKPGNPSIKADIIEEENKPTYAENEARQKGIIKEGEELGRIRATSKKELDQDYQQALQLKTPFKELNKIINNPIFQNLRNLPGFQELQLKGKINFGTEKEKELIGKFQAAAQNVVAATVKGFGGRILASEIPLAESMKLTAKDPIGVMLGKAPALEYFNEMTLQRSRIASQLMKKYHLDKGEALEEADKMVDGEAIRRQVESELAVSPIESQTVTIRNKKTGESKTISVEEARKLGVPNV